MEEGSGTRSSLLWEVKRLLEECEDLPQVLMMENVPQVHSKSNMPHFQRWIDFLSSKGYTTFWEDLNAKDYGVAQSRNRTFAISILGDFTYSFPEKMPLSKRMKDYLEPNVPEKYYLTTDKAKAENIKEKMCDEYCRYPIMPIPKGKTEDWLIEDPESPCNICPLSIL